MLNLDRRQACGIDGLLPFAQVRAITPSPALHVRCGAGAQPDVAAAGPISEVVPALLPKPGVVTDLVRRHVRFGYSRSSVTQHLQFERFLRLLELPQPPADRDGS